MADLAGNVLITQIGQPTAVVNSSLCGVIEEAFEHADHIEEIYGALNGVRGILNEDLADLGAENHKTIQGLRRTPSSALGTSMQPLQPQDESRVLQVIQQHNIRYFVVTGASDAMDVALRVQQMAQDAGYELRVMGIPKAADNNLSHTDHAPGYGSVARWLAIALRDVGRNNDATYQTHPIHVIETAGGSTGWMAAATALARDHDNAAPHLIYVPENPFNEDNFIAEVQQVYERLDRAVIVVDEGVKNQQGEPVGGAARLCQLVTERLRLSAVYDRPGSLQRASQVCVSRVDAEEAYTAGRKVISLAVDGYSGYMVTLLRDREAQQYKPIYGTARLEDVAGVGRPLPREYLNERANDVTAAFLDYVRPLIGGPLPEYVLLEKFPVEKKLTSAG
jgi:6-phosphofructokinase 1